MNNRKERVKKKLQSRKQFYRLLNKLEKEQARLQSYRFKLPPGSFRATFLFTPGELGVECDPLTIEQNIKKVTIVAQGKPTPDFWEVLRNKTLQELKEQSTIDYSSFKTTAEETNETNTEGNPG